MSEPSSLTPEDAAFFRALQAAYPNGMPAEEWNRLFVGPTQPGFLEALRYARDAFEQSECAHGVPLDQPCDPCGSGPVPEGFHWGRDRREER